MKDVIHSTAPILGNTLAWIGLARIWDNHGNGAKGKTLACAGKERVDLTYDQWTHMYGRISFPHQFLAIRFDGEIPVLFGAESPLQTMCRELHPPVNHKSVER